MSESNERTGSTWQLEPTSPIPTLHLGGIWRLEHSLPTPEIIVGQAKSLKVDASGVTEWDTGLVAFLFTLNRMLVEREWLLRADRGAGSRRFFGYRLAWARRRNEPAVGESATQAR